VEDENFFTDAHRAEQAAGAAFAALSRRRRRRCGCAAHA
jgi:hypothetical protein